MTEKKLWFKRKWFGWGWYPASWEGWVVTLVYTAILVVLGLTLDDDPPSREIVFMFVLPAAILTALFIRIACSKGEAPKWQWGKPRDEE